MKQKLRDLGMLGAGLMLMGCIRYPSMHTVLGFPLIPAIGMVGIAAMVVANMTRKS